MLAKGEEVMKGKINIVTEYYLQCVTDDCVNDTIYHGWRLRDAEESFRGEGWSKKKAGWTCPKCSKKGR